MTAIKQYFLSSNLFVNVQFGFDSEHYNQDYVTSFIFLWINKLYLRGEVRMTAIDIMATFN